MNRLPEKWCIKVTPENKQILRDFKKEFIDKFIELHNKVIPWNTIRYIF